MKQIFFILLLISSLLSKELILPVEESPKVDIKKALLGKKLFFDTRLSQDNSISCASCHDLSKGGDDNRQFSLGIHDQIGELNAPTVFNSKYNFVQFWDGRARNLKEQAIQPIHNPIEMGSSMPEVVKKLSQDEKYQKLFLEVYAGPITQEHILDAIVEFENALITPNAPFDLYLKGDKTALTQEEKEGFELFKSFGCISCHNGRNLGGNLFQKVGVIKPVEQYKDKYLGRYNVTQKEEDKYYYKVPTLRNVEKTAPYLHSGSYTTLKETVSFMMNHQLGIQPDDETLSKIEAFLKTLTGNRPQILEMD
ncbi:cytochrome-c peroxidase [Candidatus Marinarcus aquaticus]|uniref:Cytochrome B6 n=1 Tax=Candidatus Marinarcus aquaticus TaxID=2044504 RepID=A0A4Q0XRV7_9BACT|nr:cytochrome c peroxidase [Candidatus Marinarcus aquaticus]RXJ58035.1 cytochrome B6 [Candidatus Marinarcus aquaticus]